MNVVGEYEQSPAIESITTHPSFVAGLTNDYDVALIKLQTPLTYNSRIRPVCLPTSDFTEGTTCYISGWGHIEEGGSIHQVRYS